MNEDKSKKKTSIFKKLFKRKKFIAAVIIVVLGFIIYFRLISKKNGNGTSVKIERGTVREDLILSGEINADEYASLKFPTSGEIEWVSVKEGDSVKKGQALIKLDTTVLNTTFQQARATLRAADATVANIHDQVKDHSGNETYAQKDTRTTAEVTKDKAYEAYVAAEYNLRNATLYAPFTGVVTYLSHSFPGVNVIYTESQVEIINPNTIYFDVSGDQSEVIDVYNGQKVNIVLDSLPEESLEGIVDFISYTPKAGEPGTVYKIKVRLLKDNFDLNKFRIGMSGDAKFLLGQKDNVLFVPPKYVNSDSKGKFVNLGKRNNKVYIKVGIEGEDRVEIEGNIKEGDTVFD